MRSIIYPFNSEIRGINITHTSTLFWSYWIKCVNFDKFFEVLKRYHDRLNEKLMIYKNN